MTLKWRILTSNLVTKYTKLRPSFGTKTCLTTRSMEIENPHRVQSCRREVAVLGQVNPIVLFYLLSILIVSYIVRVELSSR